LVQEPPTRWTWLLKQRPRSIHDMKMARACVGETDGWSSAAPTFLAGLDGLEAAGLRVVGDGEHDEGAHDQADGARRPQTPPATQGLG